MSYYPINNNWHDKSRLYIPFTNYPDIKPTFTQCIVYLSEQKKTDVMKNNNKDSKRDFIDLSTIKNTPNITCGS